VPAGSARGDIRDPALLGGVAPTLCRAFWNAAPSGLAGVGTAPIGAVADDARWRRLIISLTISPCRASRMTTLVPSRLTAVGGDAIGSHGVASSPSASVLRLSSPVCGHVEAGSVTQAPSDMAKLYILDLMMHALARTMVGSGMDAPDFVAHIVQVSCTP
jgi:hypothetical protein